ncbi:hypothetical protein AB0G04_38075 [Actinoplanes sp. NPDC023801]|uniref:SCO4225 family membrane protein n=1 Tax=Actinoplanes sp. NPDC023801 TaxID=3154595 RepID=UPI0033CC3447
MRIVGWFVGSRLARIYLIAVTVMIVWAMVTFARHGQPAADVHIFGALLITGPGSWPLLAAAGRWNGNTGVFLGCVVAGALANAALLNWVAAVIRRERAVAGSGDGALPPGRRDDAGSRPDGPLPAIGGQTR